MHPTRMPFSAMAGCMDLIIPSTALLAALYITRLGIACQDAIKNKYSERLGRQRRNPTYRTDEN